MQKIDPCQHDTSLEDGPASSIVFKVKLVVFSSEAMKSLQNHSIILMITGERIPLIKEMTTDYC
jgi:hypothetical protein